MNAIPIGTEFMSRGKNPHRCKVIDVYTTVNSSGEIVKVSYVAEYDFCGQTITEYDIPAATIERGKIT